MSNTTTVASNATTTTAIETTTLALNITGTTTPWLLNTTTGITTVGLNGTTDITTIGLNETTVDFNGTTGITTSSNVSLVTTTGPDIWQLYFLSEFLPGTGIPLWVNWVWIGTLLLAVIILGTCLFCKAQTTGPLAGRRIRSEPQPKPIPKPIPKLKPKPKEPTPENVPEVVINIDLNELIYPYPRDMTDEQMNDANKQETIMETNKVLVTKNDDKWKNAKTKVVNLNKVISEKGWFVGNVMPASKAEKNKFKDESKRRAEYNNAISPKAIQLQDSTNDWEAMYDYWYRSKEREFTKEIISRQN